MSHLAASFSDVEFDRDTNMVHLSRRSPSVDCISAFLFLLWLGALVQCMPSATIHGGLSPAYVIASWNLCSHTTHKIVALKFLKVPQTLPLIKKMIPEDFPRRHRVCISLDQRLCTDCSFHFPKKKRSLCQLLKSGRFYGKICPVHVS